MQILSTKIKENRFSPKSNIYAFLVNSHILSPFLSKKGTENVRKLQADRIRLTRST